MKATIVADTSALVEILLARNPDDDLRRRLMTSVAAAPDLIDIEFIAVARRWSTAGLVADDIAHRAVRELAATGIVRVPHRPLLDRVWALRQAVTPYDAGFVALAEQLELPLVTTDARLAGSNGHHARVELYPRT